MPQFVWLLLFIYLKIYYNQIQSGQEFQLQLVHFTKVKDECSVMVFLITQITNELSELQNDPAYKSITNEIKEFSGSLKKISDDFKTIQNHARSAEIVIDHVRSLFEEYHKTITISAADDDDDVGFGKNSELIVKEAEKIKLKGERNCRKKNELWANNAGDYVESNVTYEDRILRVAENGLEAAKKKKIKDLAIAVEKLRSINTEHKFPEMVAGSLSFTRCLILAYKDTGDHLRAQNKQIKKLKL